MEEIIVGIFIVRVEIEGFGGDFVSSSFVMVWLGYYWLFLIEIDDVKVG